VLVNSTLAIAQSCTPLGDEVTYGTNDVWLGYIYDNQNFTNYAGYVTEGTIGNPNFDESFTGDYANYITNGCPIYTQTFSSRYKLIKNITPGTYEITVGGDDGYRLSIDGGATWLIDQWFDHAYKTTTATVVLSGSYNLVLEFYENGGGNRVSFDITPVCIATGSTSIYGTNDTWIGYIYDGMNLDPLQYKGYVNEGTAGNPNFDEGFGGDNVNYNTSACPVFTETFSARYRLKKNFANGIYNFSVGGDDGYRLSIDGGATWLINNWNDHGYTTSSATGIALNGTYDLVLEFYENGGQNRVTFVVFGTVLPLKFINFIAKKINNQSANIKWQVQNEDDVAFYELQKTTDNINFNPFKKVIANALNYDVVDDKINSNNIFYRLKIVEKSGSISYSTIAEIKWEVKKTINIYPNIITNNKINISTTFTLLNQKLFLYDPTGRLINEIPLPKVITAGSTISLNLSNTNIGKGNYILSFIDKNGAISAQLISVL
jgi:hypothetical protein